MTQVLDRQRVRLPLLAGEKWWGGAVADGQAMPFGADVEHHRDLAVSAGFSGPNVEYGGGNQSAPLLLSNRGRFIFSELPFEFRFDQGSVEAIGSALLHGRAGDSLADAFRTASAAFFPPSGTIPAEAMFRAPQYNTW